MEIHAHISYRRGGDIHFYDNDSALKKMLFLFSCPSVSIKYKSIGNGLIISGTGSVTKEGVRSEGNYNLFESIEIKEGPNSIEDGAFFECFNLVSISFPASVTKIGVVFFRNKRLSQIKVSESNSFYCADSQGILYDKKKTLVLRVPTKSVSIPEGVVTIGKFAFSCNKQYKWDIVFPRSLKDFHDESLNEASFKSVSFKQGSLAEYIYGFTWSEFESVRIPASCLRIESYAFQGSVIDSFLFDEPSSLNEIKRFAFERADIKSIALPNSLWTLHNDAFYMCKNLSSVSIGNSCRDISLSTFSGCISLKTVTVASDNWFYITEGCMIMDRLKTTLIFINGAGSSLTIPNTVVSIGINCLQMQDKLKDVQIQNDKFWAIDGVVYSRNLEVVYFVCGGLDAVLAHANVRSINSNAAMACKKLKSFRFSGSLCTSIESQAFLNSGLETFELPDSIVYIKVYAFMDCLSLTLFTIKSSSNLQEIQDFAFNGCVFPSVFIPNKVRVMSDRAFHKTSLNTVTFAKDSVLTCLGERAFWLSTIHSIAFADSITEIKVECFKCCYSLSSVVFNSGSKLSTIGEDAFKDCTSLVSISLPNSCTVIDNHVFSNCHNLNSFIYSSLTSVGPLCFYNCTKLRSFYVQNSLKHIYANTFTGCTSLNSFDLQNHPVFSLDDGVVFNKTGELLYLYPPGRKEATISKRVLEFRENAFSGCSILRDLIFVSGNVMKSFEAGSFLDCVSLRNIQLPPLLEVIGANCFRGCISLHDITLPTGLVSIGIGAFKGCDKLQFVKYCGTNFVEGDDIFPESLESIYVTKFYPEKTLGSKRVVQNLKVNCEIDIPPIQCSYSLCINSLRSYLFMIVLIKS